MTVAVVFSGEIDGGIGTYDEELKSIFKGFKVDVNFIFFNEKQLEKGLKKYKFSKKIRFILNYLRSTIVGYFLLKKINLGISRFEKDMKAHKCKMIWFTSPNFRTLGIKDIPYIATEWDIGHRKLPFDKEISFNGKFEIREYYNNKVLPKSTFVVVDSLTTKKELVSTYNLIEDKIFVCGLPIRSSVQEINFYQEQSILEDFDDPYLIYPAKFWKHKNHKVLIEACMLLRADAIKFKLIFTGEAESFDHNINNLIKNLHLEKNVFILNNIDRILLLNLIKKSHGLVMPSLLGPTNFPVYEAISMGVPVIASDVHEVNELTSRGDVTFIDPHNEKIWAKHMGLLLSEKRSNNEITVTNMEEFKRLIIEIKRLLRYL